MFVVQRKELYFTAEKRIKFNVILMDGRNSSYLLKAEEESHCFVTQRKVYAVLL
jgi:hypothetical protein